MLRDAYNMAACFPVSQCGNKVKVSRHKYFKKMLSILGVVARVSGNGVRILSSAFAVITAESAVSRSSIILG